MRRHRQLTGKSLSDKKVEKGILQVLECHCVKAKKITDYFSARKVVQIIHECTELFSKEPALIERCDLKNDVIVVGDLYGSMMGLLKTIEHQGLPPQKYYVFLGNYVDKGTYQLELILFLLLMKIRWPRYIIMLRGNHEDCIKIDDKSFLDECRKMYGLNVFYTFVHMFDHMPLCAIIENKYMLCHGGVSQWMTCRENIRKLPKPAYLNKMKFAEAALIADLLWADPNNMQEVPFKAGPRGSGYSFNKDGLTAVLDLLRVETLIRGNQCYPNGVTKNFGDNSCYTVHSEVIDNNVRAGTLRVALLRRSLQLHHLVITECERQYDIIDYSRIKTIFLTEFEKIKRSVENKFCYWCQKPFPKYIKHRIRFAAHLQIVRWMEEFAMELIEADEQFCTYRSNKETMASLKRLLELFPVYLDITNFRINQLELLGGTLRVFQSLEDTELMFKYFPRTMCVFRKHPIARDVDKRMTARNSRYTHETPVKRTFRLVYAGVQSSLGNREFTNPDVSNEEIDPPQASKLFDKDFLEQALPIAKLYDRFDADVADEAETEPESEPGSETDDYTETHELTL